MKIKWSAKIALLWLISATTDNNTTNNKGLTNFNNYAKGKMADGRGMVNGCM
jgi:hypothetical protein